MGARGSGGSGCLICRLRRCRVVHFVSSRMSLALAALVDQTAEIHIQDRTASLFEAQAGESPEIVAIRGRQARIQSDRDGGDHAV